MSKFSIPFENRRPDCQEEFPRLSLRLSEKIFAGQVVSEVELRKWIKMFQILEV